MKITDKIRIRDLQLENRLVMAPMESRTGTEEGEITEELIEYYKKRSGFVSLIITGHCTVDPGGRATSRQIMIHDDACIEKLKQLSDAIHEQGTTKVFLQISHAGSNGRPYDPNDVSVSVSGVANPKNKDGRKLHVLEKEEIHKITEDFIKAALRAKKAGYDGIELHSAHGYLLNQFYSPLTNFRTDEYNGIHRSI